MEPVAAAMLALLVKQVVDFLRYLLAGAEGRNGAITTITAWVGGVAATLLAAASDWASALDVGGVTLDSMNFASQVFAGLTVAATATGINELIKGINAGSDTAKPHLTGDGEG